MSRTQKTSTIATEFAHACAERRVHDADLCERIRALEEEVERLKAQPSHCGCHYHYYPQWSWTTTSGSPYVVTSGTTTTGSITYGN